MMPNDFVLDNLALDMGQLKILLASKKNQDQEGSQTDAAVEDQGEAEIVDLAKS